MTHTKARIIKGVSEDTGFTKKKTAETVDILLEIVKATLASGENVSSGDHSHRALPVITPGGNPDSAQAGKTGRKQSSMPTEIVN